MKNYNKLMDGSRILLGSHRGDRKNFPENTILAFKSAVEMGCDAIETDVRMTKDGHLVLIHDRDVERTTNGKGFVDEMTLEEIQALDAGFWKAPEFSGARIPTVEEFLEYVSKTDLIINWELKEYPKDLGLFHSCVCVDKLVELIDKYGMAERSMMNSFSEQILEYVFDKWPGKFVIHGYIAYKSPKDFSSSLWKAFSIGRQCGTRTKRILKALRRITATLSSVISSPASSFPTKKSITKGPHGAEPLAESPIQTSFSLKDASLS